MPQTRPATTVLAGAASKKSTTDSSSCDHLCGGLSKADESGLFGEGYFTSNGTMTGDAPLGGSFFESHVPLHSFTTKVVTDTLQGTATTMTEKASR